MSPLERLLTDLGMAVAVVGLAVAFIYAGQIKSFAIKLIYRIWFGRWDPR